MEARGVAQDVLFIALITLMVFGPFVKDVTLDLCFVVWLMCSFMTLVVHRHFQIVLPVYWYCTAMAVVVLPPFYNGVPTMLRSTSFMVLLRALHVGLLESRGGYGTDVAMFGKSNGKLTAALTCVGVALELAVTFGVMKFVGFSTLSSALMASISPAPSPEVAFPVFELMTSSCTEAVSDLKTDENCDSKRKRVEDIANDLGTAVDTFKATAFPSIVFTIIAFCSVASGVNCATADDALIMLQVSSIASMTINGLVGIGVALLFSALMYAVGYLLVRNGTSSHSMASLLFCSASFSMFYIARLAPVASALGAIGSCICLRWSAGFDDDALSKLSMFWPYTSLLYYATFAYVVVGFFTLHHTAVWAAVWKMSLGSLVPFVVKLIALSLLTRAFKTSWPACLTLTSALCSKGTVQIALSVLLPLKTDLNNRGEFVEEALMLQLYVLINFLVVLPCNYIISQVIAMWIRK